MPQVAQPAQLQSMAFDTLLEFVIRFYDQLGVSGSSVTFRGGISAIKKDVCSRIPWRYLADFCTRFLDEFLAENRDETQRNAALEITMDTEIVGLRCRGEMFRCMEPQDGHRFQKPVELDFTVLVEKYFAQPTNLKNYHFNDLTTFIYPRYCSDSDLSVIGSSGLKLEVLKVVDSKITDEGLRALSRCSELRVVDVSMSDLVSHIGVNHLLSTHEKLEELCFGSRSDFDRSLLQEPADILSRLDSAAVCPSMKSLWIHEAFIQDEHLRSIVAKFPNLTSFSIKDSTVADLVILATLNKLETIELNFVRVELWHYDCYSPSDIEYIWQRLRQLLSLIGTNIKTLKFCCWDHGFFWSREGLDFILQSCPDLEYLKFDHGADTLVIPRFQKLKQLIPYVPIYFASSEIIGPPVIEFDELINLEHLTLIDFGVSLESVKSIMLDDVKFPKLKELTTDCLTKEEVREIERLAKSNNLDFKVKNTGEISGYSEVMYSELMYSEEMSSE